MIPERELEQRVVKRVQQVKDTVPEWEDPLALAHSIGIRVESGSLGPDREGAALDGLIVLDPGVGVPGRTLFTFYHEIVHHLIREDDELYSILHDQYENANDLTRFTERLANVGAAEFLVPQEAVLNAVRRDGFSLSLLRALQQSSPASPTAVCVQLGLCAPHRCVSVVARQTPLPSNPAQGKFIPATSFGLTVEVAVSSRSMKYAVAKGTRIPPSHVLHTALSSQEGQIVNGKDRIPFRRETNWVVDCEAVRIGGQVFALFHADPAPGPTVNQLLFDI